MPKNASFYKPFKLKYVLCNIIGNGPEVSTWTTDNKNNRIPVFFDTKADAAQEIIDNAQCVVNAIQRGDYTEDRLEDCFSEFIAEAMLDKTGHLYIRELPNEVGSQHIVYDGKISGIVK